MKCHIPRENNILSCIYFTSFVLQIEKLYYFKLRDQRNGNNRVKERVFYMSCFDRFTKLKRNDEIEVSVPLISFAFDKYLSGRRTQSDLLNRYGD